MARKECDCRDDGLVFYGSEAFVRRQYREHDCSSHGNADGDTQSVDAVSCRLCGELPEHRVMYSWGEGPGYTTIYLCRNHAQAVADSIEVSV